MSTGRTNATIGGGKPEQTKTVPLNMASGDQVITPDTDKVLTQVTVEKPATLVAGNIKKDVNIGGVTGTFEGGAQPQLFAPTLSGYHSGDNLYAYITKNADNGNFLTGYEMFCSSTQNGDYTSLGVISATNAYNCNINNAVAVNNNMPVGTNWYYFKAVGANFTPSDATNKATIDVYSATFNYSHCTKSSGSPDTKIAYFPYETYFEPDEGYNAPDSVTITMGGNTYTLNDNVEVKLHQNSTYYTTCAVAKYIKSDKRIVIKAQGGLIAGFGDVTFGITCPAKPSGYSTTIHISGTAEEYNISSATLDVDGNSYSIEGGVGSWDTDYPNNDTQITASVVTLELTNGVVRWKDSNTGSWQTIYSSGTKTWNIPSNGFEIWIDIDMDE